MKQQNLPICEEVKSDSVEDKNSHKADWEDASNISDISESHNNKIN